LGVKSETVKAWERDEHAPRGNRLMLLAGILNVSVNWLLTGADEGAPLATGSLEEREVRGLVETLRQQLMEAGRTLDKLTQRVE
jgi:transcriptional regulator with XRE-family HTH domain